MQKKKLMNFRPFLFSAVSIALGIVCGYLFYFQNLLVGVAVILGFFIFVTLITFLTGEKTKYKFIFALIFIIVFCFGFFTINVQIGDYDKANLNGHTYTISGKVTSVNQTEYGLKLNLSAVNVRGERNGALRYGVSVYVNGIFSADIGDNVQFSAKLKDKGVLYEDMLCASDIERGIKYTANVDADKIIVTGQSINAFESVHMAIRDSLKAGLGDREWAVGYALLLGSTDDIDYDLITSYRSAGVAHIFAVSGLHIGFLATVLNIIFDKFKSNKILKAVLITLALFFYSGVCGFSASSLRAGVMSAVLLFSSIRGNRYDGLSSVGLACTLILACSPINLFCVGFQLSFTVVLGMILFSSPIAKIFRFLPKKLANSLGAVLAAQISGIPICLASFGHFSTIAIIANLLLIPLVGVIFIALIVTAILGALFGISYIFLFVPKYALIAINALITAIDYKIFMVGGFSFGIFALFYYLSFILPCGLINLKKISKIIATSICVIVCAVGTVWGSIDYNLTPKIHVIGSESVCSTIIQNDGENLMIVSCASDVFSLSRYKRLADKADIEKIDVLVFTSQAVKDMQVHITRLRTVFELEKIRYYGITDLVQEEAIKKSFGLSIRSFYDSQDIDAKTKCVYKLNGYAVELNLNDKKLVIFSKMDNYYASYSGLNGNYELMVAVNYLESIYNLYTPEKFISFRDNSQYKSAESEGTVSLCLK